MTLHVIFKLVHHLLSCTGKPVRDGCIICKQKLWALAGRLWVATVFNVLIILKGIGDDRVMPSRISIIKFKSLNEQ